MLRSWRFVCLLLLATALPAAAAPVLSSISPSSGYPGTQVTLNGSSFGATQGSGAVWLGNKLAGSIVSWSDTQIVAVVASGALSGSVQVKQGGVWGNSLTFTVITPAISSISPTSGYPGNQVTINGTNFGASQGSGLVWLGNKYAGSIVSWSNTQIVATVASNASGTGTAQVFQSGVWGNSVAFTVITPTLTSVSPTTGAVGTQVTFTGTNFGATQGTGSVWLGSKLAGSIVSWSNTQIVATVASGSVSGSAQVQQGGVWSNSLTFTVVTPALGDVSPAVARAGDEVTLTGTNFGATQGSSSVWLGSKLAASIVSWSDTAIVAVVDSGSVSGTAQVQRGGVWSNALDFEVITPSISSHYPCCAPVGEDITIWGSGFGASQGSGKVWIGTKYATNIVSWSDDTIVATVPAGTASGTVQVFQNGVFSNTVNFTLTVLTIDDFYLGVEYVVGGFETYGVVTLTDPAPAGGLTVTLSSSDAHVIVPATVTVLEGHWDVFFTVQTTAVTATTAATVTATDGISTFYATTNVTKNGVQYLDFGQSELQPGEEVTGHVTLYLPAPAGGAVVALTSSNANVLPLPATVTVPEGETEATFPATAGGPVATVENSELTATYEDVAATYSVYMQPPQVTAITISPTSVVGGEEDATVEVTLSAPAAEGTTVYFNTTDSGLDIDALVFPEGETTAQTTLHTSYIEETTTIVVTAAVQYQSPGVSASIEVQQLALTLDSITISPDEVVGSNPTTLTVNITEAAPAGGFVVDTFAYNSASTAPFVVVPEGETSVTTTIETEIPEDLEETDAFGGAKHAATFRGQDFIIHPPSGAYVSSFTLATSRTAGGNLVTATVTLSEEAGVGGAVIALDSSDVALATVPSTVTVPEGETTATFDVDTDAVVASADVTIRATYNSVIRKARLQVVPTEGTLSLISLNLDDNVYRGNDLIGSVTLSAPAPAGGTVVTLGGSRADIATVPASVTVPEGETTGSFTITTDEDVDFSRRILVTATYDGIVRSQLVVVVYSNE
jgi:trimeric autotransporter adhesin